MEINIIGAGFAGCEAAWFLAEKGLKVNLFEMRNKKTTPAHKTDLFAELVCSNSFKSKNIENAHGLLKKEMEILDSIIIKTAYENEVPAGQSLAVDRNAFSASLTKKIKNNKNINFINKEITSLTNLHNNDNILIIASGPLTSDALEKEIIRLTGKDSLFFFDAAAPIVDANSIDFNKVFYQSRYDKGTPDYLNSCLTKEEYTKLVEEIKNSEKIKPHDFENDRIFSGCMPIESIVESGFDTLAFGPMKPVGITDPKTGRQSYAVLQMRSENINKTMFNLVGFQTRMKWSEQDRIFKLIPGLENAVFLKYGVMHKNTFLNMPQIINKETMSLNNNKNIFFAGQITGVEGYIESAASGLYTSYAVWAGINGKTAHLPSNTMIGRLQGYTATYNINYQPMASNFGLINKDVFNNKNNKIKGRDKKLLLAEESLKYINEFFLLHFS